MPELITKNQIKRMWATAHKLGLEEDQLRDIVEQVTGQRSISSLSRNMANKVLIRLTPQQQTQERTTGPRMITDGQKKKVWALVFALNWNDNGRQRARLEGYLKKYVEVEKLDWLTQRQANRVIEGLKKMKERQAQ